MLSRGQLLVQLALQQSRKANDEGPSCSVDEGQVSTNNSAVSSDEGDNTFRDPNYTPSSNEDEIIKIYTEILEEDVHNTLMAVNTSNTIEEGLPNFEKGKRKREKGKLVPPCKCKKKCFEIVSELERKRIFDNFQLLKFSERRMFLDKHIKSTDVKVKTVNTNKRNKSLFYYLSTVDEQRQHTELTRVCKTMFLHTIGKKTDGIITQYFATKKTGLVNIKDGRGQKIAAKRKDKKTILDTKILEHIEEFKPVRSHYTLKNAPYRRYLPSELTIKFLDFNSKYDKVTYEKYRKVFASANIGFSTPGQDYCDKCSLQKEHNRNKHQTITDKNQPSTSQANIAAFENCEECQKYKIHAQRYTIARDCYIKDKEHEWNLEENIYTVDMQKVFIIPKMTIKNSYFVSRLVVMNETFAPLHKDKNKCVLWHEAINGRSAAQVASTYFKIIKMSKPEIQNFTFWADNCSAQNKNFTLMTACTIFVNNDWGPKIITLKLFEPGHSFMKSDAAHGNIGKEWNRRKEILNMDDVADCVGKAEPSNEVICMASTDFYNFVDGSRKRNKKKDEKEFVIPLLKNIRILQFKKGSRSFFYGKYINDTVLTECNFLKNNFDLKLPSHETEERGINTKKIKIIEKSLLPHMPARKRIFWEEMKQRENIPDIMCNYSEK